MDCELFQFTLKIKFIKNSQCIHIKKVQTTIFSTCVEKIVDKTIHN